MESKVARILLTGLPGCGKTTAVMKVIARLDRVNVAGFYTEEIRAHGVRKGFRWMRLNGERGILAHVDIKASTKVGKYGVDTAGFERDVVPALSADRTDVQLFVIDEIGKMECFSDKFVEAVRKLFYSDHSVLATVAQKGAGLISEVKNYPETRLFNLTTRNRDETVAEIVRIFSSLH